MTMKRIREEDNGEIEALAMANCLMLMSRFGAKPTAAGDRLFECKTCNRKFTSFQALGGHRASHHKKSTTLLLTEAAAGAGGGGGEILSSAPPPPKKHECAICGVEFAVGQALGGHMRRHRAAAVPVLNKSPSSKRVFGLDLNLTPYENNLNLKLDCFI